MSNPNPPITEQEVKDWCAGSLGTDFAADRLADILNGDYPLEQAVEDILSFRPAPQPQKENKNV